MGSWSAAPFGNDTARDWLWGLKGEAGEDLIAEVIDRAATADEYVDADLAEQAVAAAAVIAAAAGDPVRKVPREAKDWISRRGYVPDRPLIEKAISAVRNVLRQSDLKDLWQEGGSLDAWLRQTEDVAARLQAASRGKLPQRQAKKPATPRLLYRMVERYAEERDESLRQKIRNKLDALEDVDAGSKATGNQPPIVMLAEAGLTEEIGLLVERGADIDRRGSGGNALTVACRHGHTDTARMLLDAGAALYEDVLMDAENSGLVIVDPSSFDGETTTYRYCPGLLVAAMSGNPDTIDLMLERGAKLDQLDLNGASLLHYACEHGNVGTARHLIGLGCDVNLAKPHTGETPLFYAASGGSGEVVELLLRAGARADHKDDWGTTALDAAPEKSSARRVLEAYA